MVLFHLWFNQIQKLCRLLDWNQSLQQQADSLQYLHNFPRVIHILLEKEKTNGWSLAPAGKRWQPNWPLEESWKPKLKVFSHKKHKKWSDDSKRNLLKSRRHPSKEGVADIYVPSVTNVSKHLGFKNFTQFAHFWRISVESGQCHSTSN